MTINRDYAEALAANLRAITDAIETFREGVRLATEASPAEPDIDIVGEVVFIEPAPGMAGTATVTTKDHSADGLPGTWIEDSAGKIAFYLHRPLTINGYGVGVVSPDIVTNFVPDDASLWRQKCEELEAAVRQMKAATDDAEVARLRAEVDRAHESLRLESDAHADERGRIRDEVRDQRQRADAAEDSLSQLTEDAIINVLCEASRGHYGRSEYSVEAGFPAWFRTAAQAVYDLAAVKPTPTRPTLSVDAAGTVKWEFPPEGWGSGSVDDHETYAPMKVEDAPAWTMGRETVKPGDRIDGSSLASVLDAAPVGTQVSSARDEKYPWEKYADGWHTTVCTPDHCGISSEFVASTGPLVVIRVGGAE